MELTWEKLREELNIFSEDEAAIAFEEELIRTMVEAREKQGLTQSELAGKCQIKQSMLARLERGKHSPRVSSLLKILVPLGYKLKIVPINQKN